MTFMSDLCQIYVSACQNDMYGLRSNNRKLHLPKNKTNFLKRTYSYRGALVWYKLPQDVVDKYESQKTRLRGSTTKNTIVLSSICIEL